MPNKDKNIPKRRFKAFENADAWEQRKLGEVIEKLKGGVSIAPNDYIEDGYRTIPKGAVNDTGVADMSACKNVSVDFFEKNYFSKTSTGELITSLRDLVPSAPNLGRIVRIVGQFEEFIMPQGVYSLKITDNLLEDFLIAYSNNYIYRSVIQSEKNGSTQVHIRNGEFLNIKIQVPSLPEQEAIGNFFSTLDRHITLHQRKLDMLKEQKKTCLKLLFPAKGQTKPVLRFQGFEDDWEKVKLGEIGETFTGLSGKTKEDFGHGEGKFITYVNVFNNPISDLLGTDRIEVDESQTNVQFGDIFFTTSSETPEEVGMSSVWLGNGNNIYLNSFCFGFRPTLKLSNHFMAYVLRSTEIRKKFIFLAQGISRYNISKTKVMNISIPLPTLPEQESIGTFFQTLDQEIAQVEDKLASLKEMKKTLLRKLFV